VPDAPGVKGLGSESVGLNVFFAGAFTYSGDIVRSVNGLEPGERFETFYWVPKDTAKVTITLSNVVPGVTQNQLFGDDILLTVHSAKTSEPLAARILRFRLPEKPPAAHGTQQQEAVDPWTSFAVPIAAKRMHDEKYGGIVRRSREREAAGREAESALRPAEAVSPEHKPSAPSAKQPYDPSESR